MPVRFGLISHWHLYSLGDGVGLSCWNNRWLRWWVQLHVMPWHVSYCCCCFCWHHYCYWCEEHYCYCSVIANWCWLWRREIQMLGLHGWWIGWPAGEVIAHNCWSFWCLCANNSKWNLSCDGCLDLWRTISLSLQRCLDSVTKSIVSATGERHSSSLSLIVLLLLLLLLSNIKIFIHHIIMLSLSDASSSLFASFYGRRQRHHAPGLLVGTPCQLLHQPITNLTPR